MKAHAAGDFFHGVTVARVVESGIALHAKSHGPPHDFDGPDDSVKALKRHVIDDFAYAFGSQESGHENITVRPIELLSGNFADSRTDAEITALAGIQDRSKDAGRVKAGKAKPVERAVFGNQRRGA